MLICIFMLIQLFIVLDQLSLRPLIFLQKAFVDIQHSLRQLKLALNADKTKLMLFSNSKKRPQTIPPVTTLEGNEIEMVHGSYFQAAYRETCEEAE